MGGEALRDVWKICTLGFLRRVNSSQSHRNSVGLEEKLQRKYRGARALHCARQRSTPPRGRPLERSDSAGALSPSEQGKLQQSLHVEQPLQLYWPFPLQNIPEGADGRHLRYHTGYEADAAERFWRARRSGDVAANLAGRWRNLLDDECLAAEDSCPQREDDRRHLQPRHVGPPLNATLPVKYSAVAGEYFW